MITNQILKGDSFSWAGSIVNQAPLQKAGCCICGWIKAHYQHSSALSVSKIKITQWTFLLRHILPMTRTKAPESSLLSALVLVKGAFPFPSYTWTAVSFYRRTNAGGEHTGTLLLPNTSRREHFSLKAVHQGEVIEKVAVKVVTTSAEAKRERADKRGSLSSWHWPGSLFKVWQYTP